MELCKSWFSLTVAKISLGDGTLGPCPDSMYKIGETRKVYNKHISASLIYSFHHSHMHHENAMKLQYLNVSKEINFCKSGITSPHKKKESDT